MGTKLKKCVLDIIIMSYIDTNDSCGYDIFEYVNDKLGMNESIVYSTLIKYVKDGICEDYLKETEEGSEIKYFRMTSAGKEKLNLTKKMYEFLTRNMSIIMKELGENDNEK